jgi:hypothetical protein
LKILQFLHQTGLATSDLLAIIVRKTCSFVTSSARYYPENEIADGSSCKIVVILYDKFFSEALDLDKMPIDFGEAM